MSFGTETLLPVLGAFLAAGVVKGVVGLGLPTVAMAVLGVFISPAQAAALLLVPGLVTNVWQMLAGPGMLRVVQRLATLLAGAVVGTMFGPVGLATGSGQTIAVALGATLIAYAAFGLSSVQLSVTPAAERWLSPLVGVVAGVISAATGVFVIPVAPYLQALKLEKEHLVQALAVAFTVATLSMAWRLHMDGADLSGEATGSAVALVAALIGMQAGQRLRARASEPIFRRCFFIGLAATGVFLAARALMK